MFLFSMFLSDTWIRLFTDALICRLYFANVLSSHPVDGNWALHSLCPIPLPKNADLVPKETILSPENSGHSQRFGL